MSVEHHHLPAHLRVQVDHPLLLVLRGDDLVGIVIYNRVDSHLVSDDDEGFL